MNRKIIVLIVMLAMYGQAYGQTKSNYFATGNELLTYCEAENFFDRGYCIGYLAAVADTHATIEDWKNWLKTKESLFCQPKNVSQGQLNKIFIKYTNNNPSALHLTASSLVMNAFTSAFPCK